MKKEDKDKDPIPVYWKIPREKASCGSLIFAAIIAFIFMVWLFGIELLWDLFKYPLLAVVGIGVIVAAIVILTKITKKENKDIKYKNQDETEAKEEEKDEIEKIIDGEG